MKVAVASDHAGLELKNHLRNFLAAAQYEVLDLGAYVAAPDDYPDFAEAIGKAVQAGTVARGILICGSANSLAARTRSLVGIAALISLGLMNGNRFEV